MIVYHAYHKEKPAFYIGKTINTLRTRQIQHEAASRLGRTNSIFHKALRKYGCDSFEWRVLAECSSMEELNAEEIRWIAMVRECGHQLYNISDGGGSGSFGSTGYWGSHRMPDQMRKDISESLKRYYKENENPCKGKKRGAAWNRGLTKDTHLSIKRISDLKKGVPRSDETKQKLREANLGKSLHPHVIDILREKFSGANNPSAKSIRCITTEEVFDYAKLAAIKYNLDLSSIIKCCKGKLKTCGGKVFEYIQPDLT